jgi:hypothetical protein
MTYRWMDPMAPLLRFYNIILRKEGLTWWGCIGIMVHLRRYVTHLHIASADCIAKDLLEYTFLFLRRKTERNCA